MDPNYPSQFYNQEIRRGFTISEVMKRSWAADMDMVISLSQICEQHSLRFFACYGTLLGAVREHGYIPWDDDIDIGLVRDDYIKLLEILESDYSDYFNVLNPYTRSWYHMNFSHITNSRTTSFDRKYLEDWHGCPFMTGPDVYPYYYIPRDAEKEKTILGLLERIDRLIAMNRESQDRASASGKFDDKDSLNEIIATELVELQKDTGYTFTIDRPLDNQLEILYDQVCRVTQKEEADYVCRYDEYCKDRTKKFPKEYFEYTIDVPFEQITMPVMIGYDAVLQARFGNSYIVPRQESAAHDYPYYRKQLNDEEYYRKQLGDEKSVLPEKNIETVSNDTRKKIIYHTSAREMLIHADIAVENIRNNIGEFKSKESDILYAWMPDRFLKTDDCALDLVAPGLIKDYEECKREYIDNGGIIINATNDIEMIVNVFDEYCGDDGVIADCFRKAGKTVTIFSYKSIKEKSKNNSSDKKGKRDKKTVLYISGISVLYQSKDVILDKIKDVLETFSEARDEITLIWRAPVITGNIVEAFGIEFIEKYEKIKEQYKNETWCTLIETSDIDTDKIDAVYGDPDELMARFVQAGKPVMIQNVLNY